MKKLRASLGRFLGVSLLGLGLAWIWADRLPSLVYFLSGKPVQIHGVVGNRAGVISGFFPGTFVLGPTEIRNILGQPYFIAFDKDKYQAFQEVTVRGRLVDFGSQFQPIRNFFEQRLGMIIPAHAQLLIVGEEPGVFWRYPILSILSIFLLILVLRLNFARRLTH